MTLFCPNEAFDEQSGKGLMDVWGEESSKCMCASNEPRRVARQSRHSSCGSGFWRARWRRGTPYMLYKDHANRKSNQQNLGTIHCSNLCTEIMEYTSADEIAVCNLASIALPAFVQTGGEEYDFQALY
eukprot:UN25002